ncbi:site-specific DNA-methyltransferase [Francisella philomiragia]|uniref:Methyltransferase n=1 Tax=Francisella philomiragia TaxID=28110 RepID=A0A0B6CV19_9GAMM|nr:DNA methyltransferase [Francisella philomiragia]AJI54344.1 DNA methylase family protein [Francisella philomiragia]
MKIQNIEIEKIIPDINNARTHDSEQIKKLASAIDRYGFNNPLVVNQKNIILSGHARYEASKLLEIKEVPCLVVDLDKSHQTGYAIADNKISDLSGWNKKQLKQNLSELVDDEFDMDLTGFDESELLGLGVIEDPSTDGNTDQDSIPELPKDTVTKKGDFWILGKHRLICGDSTSIEVVETLLEDDGGKAQMVLTDPPYLMDYQGGMAGDGSVGKQQVKIANDNLSKEDGNRFLAEISKRIAEYCDGSWYVFFYRLGIDRLMNIMTANNLKWRNLIIWKKSHFNLSNSDYKSIYEPCIFGWQDDYVPALYGWNKIHEFHGGKNQTDVWGVAVPSIWEADKVRLADLHPTMKPVELLEKAIKNSSLKDEVVLDLFGGSGSTMIACQKLDRQCRMIELEPYYCDVIVKRWQEFTREQAINITQQKTYRELLDNV